MVEGDNMATFQIKVELPKILLEQDFTEAYAEDEMAEELVEEATFLGLTKLLREFKKNNSAAFEKWMGIEELQRVREVEGAFTEAINSITVEEGDSMLAKPLENALSVRSVETLPDGVKVVTLDCRDAASFSRTPSALEYDGEVFGRTGWNSDKCVVYYRNDKKVAFSS